jgi:hypothetical protein
LPGKKRDIQLLKLFEVGRFLLRKLPRRNTGQAFDLDDQVALRFYRLTKTGEHKIALSSDGPSYLQGPPEVGTLQVRESSKALLSQLIDKINEIFGADLGPETMLTIEQVQDKLVANETLAKQAKANSLENYRHGFDPAFLDALIALRQGNVKFFNRAIEDESFRQFIADNLRPGVCSAAQGRLRRTRRRKERSNIQAQEQRDQRERDELEWQVDKENPGPSEVIGDRRQSSAPRSTRSRWSGPSERHQLHCVKYRRSAGSGW